MQTTYGKSKWRTGNITLKALMRRMSSSMTAKEFAAAFYVGTGEAVQSVYAHEKKYGVQFRRVRRKKNKTANPDKISISLTREQVKILIELLALL